MSGIGKAIGGIFGGVERSKGSRAAGVEMRAGTQKAIDALMNNTRYGIRQLESQRGDLQTARELESPLMQFLLSQVTDPGLSLAGQLQQKTASEALDKVLASRGGLYSGGRLEAQAESAERIAAEDALRKQNLGLSLAGLRGSLASGVDTSRVGLTSQMASLYGNRGGALADLYRGLGTQLGAAKIGQSEGLAQAYSSGGQIFDRWNEGLSKIATLLL